MWDGQLFMGGGLHELAALDAQSMAAAEFYKSLSAGSATDHAGLTGGQAMARESLEASILSIEQRMKHFVFWNRVPKGNATAVVDEWTSESNVGGWLGSTANTELGSILENVGQYDRHVAKVKFLMDRRGVGGIAEIQAANGLGSLISKETDKGSRKLLTDADYLCWYGNATCNPAEFDGFVTTMEALGGANVKDLRGATVSADGEEFADAASIAWSQENWGMLTDYFCSPKVQKDISQKLKPHLRIMNDNNAHSVAFGATVRAINVDFTPEGSGIRANADPFIIEGPPPFVVRGGNFASQLSSSGTSVVTTIAGVAGAHASSQFTSTHAGDYYYAVEASRKEGHSALVKSGQVTVAAGDRVVVTITPPAGNNASEYWIYRGRKNGTNADNDFRFMTRVAANGDTAVVYNDANQNIPGTSFIACQTILEDAITFMRMRDAFRFPLFPTDKFMHLWAQIMLGYLRIGKPQQHVLIKNVLPANATWQPF